MKKLLGILVLGLLLSSNAYAVPKWLKSEILEVCKVTQDVKINQKWEGNSGGWIKDDPIFLKEGDRLTVHKSKMAEN